MIKTGIFSMVNVKIILQKQVTVVLKRYHYKKTATRPTIIDFRQFKVKYNHLANNYELALRLTGHVVMLT